MDTRQERGRRLAQDGQVKHCSGAMWFVASATAGGYLVNVDAATCSCPDAQKGAKCKHRWAVDFLRSASTEVDGDGAPLVAETARAPEQAPAPDWPRRGDLSTQEKEHVRRALRFLHTRAGGWEPLAKAIRSRTPTIKNVAYGRPATAGLAIRLARLAGVPVDDVLAGRFPPPGACPHCGRGPEPKEVGHAETV